MKIFILTAILISGLIVSPIVIFEYKLSPRLAGWNYCEDNGYNYAAYDLDYKYKDYGMIECSKCFADGCNEESFNVSKNWRGKLIKHDAYGGLDE